MKLQWDIEELIFPVMGEDKCKAVLKEYQGKGEYQEQVYQRMRASYC
jgi:hypothetical protein